MLFLCSEQANYSSPAAPATWVRRSCARCGPRGANVVGSIADRDVVRRSLGGAGTHPGAA